MPPIQQPPLKSFIPWLTMQSIEIIYFNDIFAIKIVGRKTTNYQTLIHIITRIIWEVHTIMVLLEGIRATTQIPSMKIPTRKIMFSYHKNKNSIKQIQFHTIATQYTHSILVHKKKAKILIIRCQPSIPCHKSTNQPKKGVALTNYVTFVEHLKKYNSLHTSNTRHWHEPLL